MRKRTLSLISTAFLLSLVSCKNVTPDVDKNNIAFRHEDIIQQSFGGLGVEWGAYEDTEKIIEGGWEKIISHMDHLGAARIRLMINYDWFCSNLDKKGTVDKNDDTWTYNFTNKYGKNMIDILEYCQVHNIDVAFGAWNVIGGLGDDEWGMKEEVTSDIRWAKMSADTLDFLVNKKGFTCIKWFVNSNEPNLTGSKGTSKNYNNTYAIWEQGVKNVREAFDKIGLQDIGIVGGDTTGFKGSQEYLTNIAKNIKDKVGDYGVHLYLSNISVDRGEIGDDIKALYSEVKELDSGLGTDRQANVWEAGFIDGKTPLDCQTLIATPNYAVRMTDFTIQCLDSGINGICYWDFDDAMHFMYTNNTQTPKEWGMFSSLAEASSAKQELRPWYHTSALLCNMFKKGNYVYAPIQNDTKIDNTFRSLASMSKNKKEAGFVGVNAGMKPVTKTFYFEDIVEGDKLYIYTFNQNEYRLDADGYIVPNQVISGSLNKKITLNIPNQAAVFVSNKRLVG